MTGLTDEQVSSLRPVLGERARASESGIEAFQPPEVGIVETAASARHHFILGRRGVGKSMLLLRTVSYARDNGVAAVYLDVEPLRDNPYPDVLIRLMIAVSGSIEDALRSQGWLKTIRARRPIRQLRTELQELLRSPETVEVTREETRATRTKGSASAKASAAATHPNPTAGVMGEAAFSAERQIEDTRTSSFVQTKIEALRSRAADFQRVFAAASGQLGGARLLLILDDFYFISRSEQPRVLSYLHQVVKGTGIWLKIGAVDHRFRPFEEGDPPIGLQPTQDAGRIDMDLTLADFNHARTFLEQILSDICEAAEVDLEHLATPEARTRLVLASGGVPRDYLGLAEAALSKSTKRSPQHSRPRNRITAEDVNEAAPAFRQQKEDDLKLDSTQEEASRLLERFRDLATFCLTEQRSNVFSVEASALEEETWGREIRALADLRFVHRIGNLTIKSSSSAYTGIRYEAFTLDLSAYADTRATRGIDQVEFWTTDGWQRTRGASHIYSPDRGSPAAPVDEAPEDPDQLTFDST